ncbi:hypothetical protein N7G274_009884 [Stereocaulon virgatum]|uniref:RING-type domain-containing protein n=1 Tax=Stereocaulon virgatum TaxID=373712 RepID=A0ABR3ZXY8_9LECA
MPSIGGGPRTLKSPPHIMVEDSAEDFLRALPNVRRGEMTIKGQKCSICLEPFGTTPSERGVIERPKRLPCHHVVGSECIHTWVSPNLGNKHSCPICRYKLYDAHPGSSIKLDDIEGSDELPNTDDAVDGSVGRGTVSGSDATAYVPGEQFRSMLTCRFEDFTLYRLLVDSNAQLPLDSDGHICPLNTN